MDTISNASIQKSINHEHINSSSENKTFTDDRFGRKEYADHLNQMINKSRMFKENESFTIALDASWGMGKTQFLHMWRHMLAQPDSPIPAKVVFYDAWEQDDCGNALTPLVFHICHEYNKLKMEGENTLDFMCKLLKVCFLSTIGMAALAFPPVSVFKEASKTAIETFGNDKAQDAWKIYMDQIRSRDEFKNVISSLASKEKLIIMIDELDRCRPTFAIQTLEVAKHFFNIPNVVFVFALDMRQLIRSVSTVYGQDMDASGYLARFFDVQVQLNYPAASQYLKCEPLCSYPSDMESLNIFDETVRMFSLSARETLKLLRVFNCFRPNIGAGKNTEHTCRFYFLLLTVKLKDPFLYNKILNGNTEAIQSSQFNLQDTRAADYLRFAADYAKMEINLMEARPNQTGNFVYMSLLNYFQQCDMISEPDHRLFGFVLHEWTEVYMAKGVFRNSGKPRNEIVIADKRKHSKKANPPARSSKVNVPTAAGVPQ